MRNTISIICLFTILCLTSFMANAQINICDYNGINPITGQYCVNTIVTSVPFLRIAPDARSAGMGDVGIATSADANAMHFNSSKLAFADRKWGISPINYTPWLRALGLTDVYHAYLSGYVRIGEMQTLGVSIRAFSLGTIQFTDENGQPLGTDNPFESELAISYNRKLSEKFALGLTLKSIYSKLANGQTVNNQTIVPGTSTAADISFIYQSPLSESFDLSVGGAIKNLGSKISYVEGSNRKDYIPTNLGIGSAVRWKFGEDHHLTFALDINRLLVPTPPGGNPFSSENNNSGDPTIPDYLEKSVLAAALGSFSDAPGGFSEEMRENTYSLGLEYHIKFFSARFGHFNEHRTKGNRKYLTGGIGFNYRKYAMLDFSYLFPATNQRNPLDNTFRCSLLLNFGELDKDRSSD